jgi:hypothetical protein
MMNNNPEIATRPKNTPEKLIIDLALTTPALEALTE